MLDQRRANVVGAVTGAIFVGIVLNGLTMLNVPYYTQDFVKGIVLVGALAITLESVVAAVESHMTNGAAR